MGQKINFILTPEIVSGATGGIVVGDFNNWNEDDAIRLKIQKDGSLKGSATLDEGRAYQYRYLLNDGRWVNDGNANSYQYDPAFNVENCVVNVEAKKKGAVKSENGIKSKSSAKAKATADSKKVEVKKETIKKSLAKNDASKSAKDTSKKSKAETKTTKKPKA